ncbi:MAG TPA: response regulator, partial [Steroidobacteraceae bacterium]|nr:response regulator [Steroidobacteraceae bacterium]
VSWTIVEKRGIPWLSFDWNEYGAQIDRVMLATSRRRGFGRELIEARIPYELGGRGQVEITSEGAQCHLEIPLKEGASILETDAPRATLFGGVLDMSGEADLSGERILVAEDDFYMASDTARALRGAGADVVGPCASQSRARSEIGSSSPTAAVVDINLGNGASFELASELRWHGVPFVFITGYDQAVIPQDLADVPCLQKPVDLRQIVNALASAITTYRA